VGKGGLNISIEDGISSAFAHAVGAIRVRKGGSYRVPTITRLDRLCTPYGLLVFPHSKTEHLLLQVPLVPPAATPRGRHR